ncbi:MAG: DUF6580 family putative transport protein [Isosphaeraceae bacterium]
MALGTFLIALGLACRLVPHPLNFVPMAAIALYGAARLPGKMAWCVPIAAMALSDLYLNAGRGYFPGVTAVTLVSYATLAVIALLGGRLNRDANPATRAAASLAGSTLFFLTTNCAVWAAQRGAGVGLNYGEGLPGLLESYTAALPFFGNALAADLAGTAALFGGEALARRLGWLPSATPAVSEAV